jgi:hypothetical protein
VLLTRAHRPRVQRGAGATPLTCPLDPPGDRDMLATRCGAFAAGQSGLRGLRHCASRARSGRSPTTAPPPGSPAHAASTTPPTTPGLVTSPHPLRRASR